MFSLLVGHCLFQAAKPISCTSIHYWPCQARDLPGGLWYNFEDIGPRPTSGPELQKGEGIHSNDFGSLAIDVVNGQIWK